MRKPNFFIIGAPKCGTTSVATWLAEHPQVFFSSLKEPHFFCTDGYTGVKTLKQYEKLFEGAKAHHLAVGEGSTHYLFSKVAVTNILAYSPRARFIVCLRNPIDMAPSLHSERLWSGQENIRSFSNAWALQQERAAGHHIPITTKEDPALVNYADYCRLGNLMQRLYHRVPKEQVLTLVLDDVRKNPAAEYKKLLDFLGLEPISKTSFPIYNTRKTTTSTGFAKLVRFSVNIKKRLGIHQKFGLATTLRHLNSRKDKVPPLDAKLRSELRDYFKEDIQLLQHLLNRDLSDWLTLEGSTRGFDKLTRGDKKPTRSL